MSNPLFSQDHDESEARFKLFHRWLYSPEAAQLMPSSGPIKDLQTILNDALWAAYSAGYSQAANDSEAAQRLLELLKSKDESK